MSDDLISALEHLRLVKDFMAHYFKTQRINDRPRPERASWAMTSVTHAITYLEREIRERAKV